MNRVWWFAFLVAVLVGVGVSCSSDDSSGDRANGSDDSSEVTVEGGGPANTTTTEGTRVVDDLAVTDEVSSCVGERVDADEAPSSEVEAAVVACQNRLLFAPEFVAGLAADNPGVYSDEQLACIEEGFGSLSREESTAVLEGALGAGDGNREILEGVFDGCGAVTVGGG